MLQFITHQTLRFGIVEGAVAALKGGCKWIQLRMKEAPLDEVERTARELIPLCQEHEAILVLDDYPQLAADLDVDGVHLGKLDMPVSEARLLIGEKYIIGGTANTFDDIQSLVRQDADYVGLGPFRFTETKKNLSPILGLEGYARIMRQCRENGLKIPWWPSAASRPTTFRPSWRPACRASPCRARFCKPRTPRPKPERL